MFLGNVLKTRNSVDSLQENLRQLCLHNVSTLSGKPELWWDYASRFWDECKLSTKEFGQECAEKV